MEILTKWKSNYHLYQVVNQLRSLLTQTPPVIQVSKIRDERRLTPHTTPTTTQTQISEQLNDLQDQVQQMRSELKIKDEEINDLTSTPPQEEQRIKVLDTELERAQSALREKDEEIARLKAKIAMHKVPETRKVDPNTLIPKDPEEAEIWHLESEKIVAEELLASLEDKYHDGEVSLEEYTRLFKRYQKNQYIFRKKLAALQSN